MRNFHFFKANSRLGLVNIPFGSDKNEKNVGVELAGDSILSSDFLIYFPSPKISSFNFTAPENLEEDHLKQIAREYRQFSEYINTNLDKEFIQVVIGGDHSVSFSSLLALSKIRNLENVLHIQIDSHTDIHLESTSPSGNFHGMWLRPYITSFDNANTESLISSRLRPENIKFIGNIIFEQEEQRIVLEKGIQIISQASIASQMDDLLELIENCEHLHLSIDIDAFHKSIAPATGIPAERGLYLEEIIEIIKTASIKQNISIDLVEVNPKRAGSEQTIALAQKILARLAGLEV